MIPIYATEEDLTDWSGKTAPDNAKALLRIASLRVREATRCDLYRADVNGLPIKQGLADAMRDATCQQVTTWIKACIDPDEAGTRPGTKASSSMMSGSITWADAALAAEARTRATTGLTDDALAILQTAGLASSMARVRG